MITISGHGFLEELPICSSQFLLLAGVLGFALKFMASVWPDDGPGLVNFEESGFWQRISSMLNFGREGVVCLGMLDEAGFGWGRWIMEESAMGEIFG